MAPLTNAERQAKWRAKRNALAKQALDGGKAELAKQLSGLARELGPLLNKLWDEAPNARRYILDIDAALIEHGVNLPARSKKQRKGSKSVT
jgi:hypothetical protein